MLNHHEERSANHIIVRRAIHLGYMGTWEESPLSTCPTGLDYPHGSGWRSESNNFSGIGYIETNRTALATAFPGFATGGSGKGRAPSRSHSQNPDGEGPRVVEATLHTTPLNATHWSTRSMAAVQGVSEATIRRIWKQHNLKPHLVKTFKVSHDKHFAEKLHDIVGLYLNPPDKSLVLCVDEKSQIQALDRTQPGLPMKKGRCGTMTHDYKRNGTTTLFAALSMLDGTIIGDCLPRHRHQGIYPLPQENRRRDSDRSQSALDRRQLWNAQASQGNSLAQATYTISFALYPDFKLLVEHGRAVVPRDHRQAHPPWLVPKSASIDRGYQKYIENHNQNPQVFVWTAPVAQILSKVAKSKEALDALH